MKTWPVFTSLSIAALVVGGSVTAVLGGEATTTIYVGRHFEVRDHAQPVKYLFNGDTRIARVTGSLSATQRLQRVPLRSGWNLVSLAVSATNALQQLAGGPAGISGIQSAYLWSSK